MTPWRDSDTISDFGLIKTTSLDYNSMIHVGVFAYLGISNFGVFVFGAEQGVGV